MVNIDRVYQRVLVLTNKEQRGYITPQEFNLLANQAQMDIFEQYFYDLNQFRRLNGNDTVHSDMITMLEDKISFFEQTLDGVETTQLQTVQLEPGFIGFRLPDNLYRIQQVRIGSTICEKLNVKDFNEVRFSPLTRPTRSRPIYRVRQGNIITINIGNFFTGGNGVPAPGGNVNLSNPFDDTGAGLIRIDMIRRPALASWGFTVVNGTAIHNQGNSQNFELHPSEETDLVIKILSLAGITIKDQGLYQMGLGEDNKSIQQEKS